MRKNEITTIFNEAKCIEDVRQALADCLKQCTAKQYDYLYATYTNACADVAGVHRDMSGRMYRKREDALSPEQFAKLVQLTYAKCKGVSLRLNGQKLTATGDCLTDAKARKALRSLGYKQNKYDASAFEWFTVSEGFVSYHLSKITGERA